MSETTPDLRERLLARADGYDRLAGIEDSEWPKPDEFCSAAGGDGSRAVAALLREAAAALSRADAGGGRGELIDSLHDVFTEHGIASRIDLPYKLIVDLVSWAARKCREAAPPVGGRGELLAQRIDEWMGFPDKNLALDKQRAILLLDEARKTLRAAPPVGEQGVRPEPAWCNVCRDVHGPADPHVGAVTTFAAASQGVRETPLRSELAELDELRARRAQQAQGVREKRLRELLTAVYYDRFIAMGWDHEAAKNGAEKALGAALMREGGE